MTTSQIVIEINNVACDLLERGYYQESHRLFKKTLQILKLANASKGESASATIVKDSVLKRLHKIKGQCALLRPKLSSNHGLTMHSRSFKIPKNQDTASLERPSLGHIVKVIYNIALSVHLWAMEDGIALSSHKALQALTQYGNLCKILASMLHHQEDALPILMATLNNEAQLHCENCQCDRSKQCLECLERVILKSHSIVSTKMTNMYNETFHRNIIVFKIGSTCSAPAA